VSSDAGTLESGFSDLVSLTLNHGVGSVEEGGALIPFVLVESKANASSGGSCSRDLRTLSRLLLHLHPCAKRSRPRGGGLRWIPDVGG
jgi:hypothetical protein